MVNRRSETHNERGLELVTRGWEQEAFLEFKKAIQADPSCAPAYDNIANLYAEKGDYLQALQIYLKALEIDPEDPTLHYNFGCFLSNYAGEMAVSEYQLAAQADDDFPEAHLNLGISFLTQGRLDEAIEELQVAKNLSPNDAQTSYELACALLETGLFKEAVSELRQAVKKDPVYQEAWFLLGSCYLQRGFYVEAKKALLKALKLAPQDPLCLCELAAVCLLENHKKKGAYLLKNALKQDSLGVMCRIEKNPHLKQLSLYLSDNSLLQEKS